MATAPGHADPLSVEEFAALPEQEGWRLELAAGRLAREPAPGPRHGRVAGRLYRLLWREGEEKGLGLAFFDTAFTLGRTPPTVRVPDAAFVHRSRVPPEGATGRFWELAPDLVVEVASPSDRAGALQRKALEYMDAGSALVWVADPESRILTVYRSRSEIRILEGGDILTGEEVLPALRAPVRQLFE